MFKRVLIANRGEIACRVGRTCRALGIEYVVVYTEADASSPHLHGAAHAICIGQGPAALSYLDGARIIATAIEFGCDAVHPGYGFLSENSEFAEAVAAAGLTFVGPRPETIAALGDKARAKALMHEAGVPVVPGGGDASDDPEAVEAIVRSVGLPALLKPSAGGGGKGMQIVETFDGLREAVASAIRVARSSFGDGRLIVERYIEQPRHIEVQVFGDSQGNVVHLFERECSLQRRHQKVVEEAPAPSLPEGLRQRLVDSAVRGARSLGYLNAGTFEFIVGRDQSFYFLEVNTRLQVEHPVTESITGVDLVEWQLRVASGEPLPLQQDAIRCEGHAMECRIYAEDPAREFRPSPGQVQVVCWPEGVRVEAGVASGGVVPPYYDPMVAKLVTHAAHRSAALQRMRSALEGTLLLGLTSNIGYLLRVLANPGVHAATVHTRYLDENVSLFSAGGNPALAAASAAVVEASRDGLGGHRGTWCDVGSLDRGGLAPAAPLGHTHVWSDGVMYSCAWLARTALGYNLAVEGEVHDIHAVQTAGGIWRGVAGQSGWAAVEREGRWELQLQGDRFTAESAQRRTFDDEGAKGLAVAPMSGTLSALPVLPGQHVQAGDLLAVVEAMKMEHGIVARQAGTVRAIAFTVGDSVKEGQLIVDIAPGTQASL